jgi:hypothetical protein
MPSYDQHKQAPRIRADQSAGVEADTISTDPKRGISTDGVSARIGIFNLRVMRGRGGWERKMIPKPVDQITESDLNDLVSAGVAERKTLDYKQQLPETNDAGRRELLADVSSFANTAGGDLIFGITEAEGLPTGIPGVQIGDTDREILRFDSIIRDGLSPRIRHTTRAVALASGSYILIIRSERSWYGPHRVIFKGDSRFYGRTTNGKYELDVTDLRNAFLFANTVAEKTAAFRSGRIIALGNGETLAPLAEGPKLVMHCMALESSARRRSMMFWRSRFNPSLTHS